MAAPLDLPRLHRALAGATLGTTIDHHAELASTNDRARSLAAEGYPHGTLVIAEFQSAGRGRRGATWVSPPSTDLLLSLIIKPTTPLGSWPRLTSLAALAVCEASDAACETPDYPLPPRLSPRPAAATIKWPNDVYIGPAKLAGLLAESTASHVILGIGWNINSTSFPHSLAAPATSLALASGGQVDRTTALIALLRALARRLPQLADDAFAAALTTLRQRSALLGHRIQLTLDGAPLFGIAEDLDPSGALILRLHDNSTRTLHHADLIRLAPA
jgi:BirA family transcriptional regulator, biotin operon repressor / biotin---[acetyl-CoA-carboxylase] ligase